MMDRRETLKSLVVGSFASSFVLTGCKLDHAEEGGSTMLPDGPVKYSAPGHGYGRTPEEMAYDLELLEAQFFTDHELATIAVLADIIIPADDTSGSATEAGVPDFIEFIVKDMPSHQIPMRGGLMWIDHESNKRFGKVFKDATKAQQLEIVEDIAYPDDVKPQHSQGAKFFSHIRNLVATGFYTSKMGIEDLGYVGNTPNVWNGVPEDVLAKHGKSYDEKYMDAYIKPEERNEIATWS